MKNQDMILTSNGFSKTVNKYKQQPKNHNESKNLADS
jgi:hypothetical protein